jgi:hypothetical protein
MRKLGMFIGKGAELDHDEMLPRGISLGQTQNAQAKARLFRPGFKLLIYLFFWLREQGLNLRPSGYKPHLPAR